MRGTPAPLGCNSAQTRFIPAHAGNTGRRAHTRGARSVHPRACGEHCQNLSVTQTRSGSSPRMRGTQTRPCCLRPQPRFIPAHAGNTVRCGKTFLMMTVHPRACGEHEHVAAEHIKRGGSSPRMRGTPIVNILAPFSVRFIPAHAGNTFAKAIPYGRVKVHPRACGEHSAISDTRQFFVGSSPRMRGTRRHLGGFLHVYRFIPAHAGNT